MEAVVSSFLLAVVSNTVLSRVLQQFQASVCLKLRTEEYEVGLSENTLPELSLFLCLVICLLSTFKTVFLSLWCRD